MSCIYHIKCFPYILLTVNDTARLLSVDQLLLLFVVSDLPIHMLWAIEAPQNDVFKRKH